MGGKPDATIKIMSRSLRRFIKNELFLESPISRGYHHWSNTRLVNQIKLFMIEIGMKTESKSKQNLLAMIILLYPNRDDSEKLPSHLRNVLPRVQELFGTYFRNNNRIRVERFF